MVKWMIKQKLCPPSVSDYLVSLAMLLICASSQRDDTTPTTISLFPATQLKEEADPLTAN